MFIIKEWKTNQTNILKILELPQSPSPTQTPTPPSAPHFLSPFVAGLVLINFLYKIDADPLWSVLPSPVHIPYSALIP